MDATTGERVFVVGERVTLRYSHRHGKINSMGLHTYRMTGGGMVSLPSALVLIEEDEIYTEKWCPLTSLAAGVQA